MQLFVFDEEGYKTHVIENTLYINNQCFKYINDILYYVQEDQPYQRIAFDQYFVIDEIRYFATKGVYTTYNAPSKLLFGSYGDIIINNGFIEIDYNNLLLTTNLATSSYVNGKLINDNSCTLTWGDEILIENILFTISPNCFISYTKNINSKLNMAYLPVNIGKDFPIYYRSPRIIKNLPDDKLSIRKPKEKEKFSRNNLIMIIVPPLVTGSATLLMAIFMGRSPIMLLGLASVFVSLVFSIYKYFNDKKEMKVKNEKRIDNYYQYINHIGESLNKTNKMMVEALSYNFPKIEELMKMIDQYNPRLYERDLYAKDFLDVVIGHYKHTPSYEITFEDDLLDVDVDNLAELGKDLYNNYCMYDDYPLTISLKNAHLGLVGEEKIIIEQLQILLWQIVTFHSYHDLSITMLLSEQEINSFKYFKYLKHFRLPIYNFVSISENNSDIEIILNSFYNILKERNQQYEDSGGKIVFDQHLLLIVTNLDLIINHSIMQILKDATHLNCSVIVCTSNYATLPEFIATIEIINSRSLATLVINEGEEVSQRHELQHLPDTNLDLLSRRLSVLNHKLGDIVNIPDSITFLEMFNVKSLDELDILSRWKNSQVEKSISVPIGIKAESELVYLNLHENAHGPHGLIAGTTGSGKSETIQTYILSLAINFSPEDVGFLLIDFKGGGMANLFKNLPHLLGTITNLDGDNIMRNLESVRAEVMRRQDIFKRCDVNNINLYTKLYKQGEVEEPLPHLFLISDEFAELKKEHPDFMKELVSIARIGRTLGIHLILATQKPTGVVDDQIWSNSKFKLALKVQDESDSKEILKTPDAAYITKAGRAYLQVGNNEIYELFQSAFSGAPYQVLNSQLSAFDPLIYQVDRIGQRQVLNPEVETNQEQNITQLDAVIDYIADIYNNIKHPVVHKTWLPTLSVNMTSPYINSNQLHELDEINNIDTTIALGKVDLPNLQKQEDYILNPVTDGNILIYGSSGYGKTTTLSTIVTSLSIKNNPNLVQFFILDFGNVGLIGLSKLPHVRDYIRFEETEKINKFQRIILDEIQERKNILAMNLLSDINRYNEMFPDQKLPLIYIIIDNMDIIGELGYDFDNFLIKVTRDAQSLGIYLIGSVNKVGGFRYALLNNFKTQIVQYLYNESDSKTILGRSEYNLTKDMKGRALVSLDQVQLMQIYLPVINDNNYERALQELVTNIADAYNGKPLLKIPMLPDALNYEQLATYPSQDNSKIKLGLSHEQVQQVGLFTLTSPFIILGPAKTGKTNFLDLIINQMDGKKIIIDSVKLELIHHKNQEQVIYVDDSEHFNKLPELLTSIIEQRANLIKEIMKNNDNTLKPIDILAKEENVSIFIDDYDGMYNRYGDGLNAIMLDCLSYNINIFITKNNTSFSGIDTFTNKLRLGEQGVLLGASGTANIFSVSSNNIPTFTNGILFDNGTLIKIKIPRVAN